MRADRHRPHRQRARRLTPFRMLPPRWCYPCNAAARRKQQVINKRLSKDIVLDLGEDDKSVGVEILDASMHLNWLTPPFVCDRKRAADPVRFALGVEVDASAALMREIRSVLAKSASIEEINTTFVAEPLYFPRVPADLFAQGTLIAQAETLSTAAMDAIIRPILDLL